MTLMPSALPIILAAEALPVELPQAGLPRAGTGLDSQLVTISGAVLLVAVPLLLFLTLSRRKKRKRKVRLPRNPTLAETGGLPPRRAP